MVSDNSLGTPASASGDRLEDPVRRVSTAVRKLTKVVRNFPLTQGCYIFAYVGQALLKRFHIDAEIHLGYAGWRLGPNSDDAVLHYPSHHTTAIQGSKLWFAYHAWLCFEGSIVDLTTFQLRMKAKELDGVEGVHTTVTWCPGYLVLPLTSVLTLSEFRNSTTPGAAYYARRPQIESFVKETEKIDRELIQIGNLLLSRPKTPILTPHGLVTDADTPE